MRAQISQDVQSQILEALRKSQHPRDRRHPRSHTRRTRYDTFYSEASGDTDSEYNYDQEEDSYSDYSDGSSRSHSHSVQSPTPAAAPSHPLDSSSTLVKDTGDSVVETKNVDVLLAKYVASGPQEEPDPTTNAIMERLVLSYLNGFMVMLLQAKKSIFRTKWKDL